MMLLAKIVILTRKTQTKMAMSGIRTKRRNWK